jgi:hypothetical protein
MLLLLLRRLLLLLLLLLMSLAAAMTVMSQVAHTQERTHTRTRRKRSVSHFYLSLQLTDALSCFSLTQKSRCLPAKDFSHQLLSLLENAVRYFLFPLVPNYSLSSNRQHSFSHLHNNLQSLSPSKRLLISVVVSL